MTRPSPDVRALLADAKRSEEIPPEARARSARRVSRMLTAAPLAASAWAAWSKVVIAAVMVGSLGGYVAARVRPTVAPTPVAPELTHAPRAPRGLRAPPSHAVIPRAPVATRAAAPMLPSHRAMFRPERPRSAPLAVAPEAPVAPSPVGVVVAPPVTPPAAPPLDAFTRELALLDAAQTALARDPEAVLAITARHRAEFPTGRLVEESEMLSLDALRRLGRADALHAQGERFLRAHPRSAYAARVRAWLDEGS